MRKNVLLTLVSVWYFALVVYANGEPNTPKTIQGGKESPIVLGGGSGLYVLTEGNSCVTANPQVALPAPRIISILLDPPPNDNCIDATIISDGDSIEYNALEATFDGPGDQIITPDIWYRYTASTTGPVRIQLDNFGENDFPHIALYDSWSCPEYVAPPTPVSLQGGETIQTATSIADVFPMAYNGTLSGYNHNYDLPCALANNNPDVVYSYTALANDSITISLCPSDTVSWIPVLAILDGDGNVLACEKDYNWFQTFILNFPVTLGETYYLVISNLTYNSELDYTLVITSPDHVLISYPERQLSNVMRLDFDAMAGHEYLIELGSRAAGIYVFPLSTGFISIGPAPAYPPNDNCENATDGGILAPGNPLQFTGENWGATPDCEAISDLPEIWVEFTTLEQMDVMLNYCGTTSIENTLIMATTFSNSCPCGPFCAVWGEIDLGTPFMNCPNYTMNLAWYNLPPGTYRYPMMLCAEIEGQYQINITGAQRQICTEDAFFGQRPSSISDMEGTNFARSEVWSGLAVAAEFSTASSDTIDQITWWGGYNMIYGAACVPDSYSFQIIFCDVDGPNPRDTVASYYAIVEPEPTGYIISEMPQLKFKVDLNPPLQLTEGWVIIRGTSSEIDSCGFLWQDCPAGDEARQYNEADHQWQNAGLGTAFCLTATAIPPGPCQYSIGDVNNNAAFNGIDVTYGVSYFKGGNVPPYSCLCNGSIWYVAGDVNGSCVFNGIDITYMVSYFKGGPSPVPCPQCPPAGYSAGNNPIVPTLQPKNINSNIGAE